MMVDTAASAAMPEELDLRALRVPQYRVQQRVQLRPEGPERVHVACWRSAIWQEDSGSEGCVSEGAWTRAGMTESESCVS